jgi:hypothetical protein
MHKKQIFHMISYFKSNNDGKLIFNFKSNIIS